MIGRYLIASAALVALLSACASPQQQRRAQQARAAVQVLDRAGTIGEPGLVANADVAFARLARDEGQWTAYRATAAPGAVVHGVNGPVPLETFIAGRGNPPVSNAWTPNTVWASCDGTLSVTFGRYQVPNGDVGSYVTVWELQNDRSFKWTYDLRALDNPQPVPEVRPDVPEGENVIIVPGMASIQGRVADCPVRGEALPPAPISSSVSGRQSDPKSSDDRTLRWHWSHATSGERMVSVLWRRDDEWQEAVAYTAPRGAE